MTPHRTLYLDIETIPCEDLSDVPEPKAPSNYKDPEKIRAYIEEARATAHAETALDPLLGRVCAVAFAIDDDAVQSMAATDERALIQWLATETTERLSGSYVTWVGHNIAGFDLRWIYYRAIRYGMTDFRSRIPWRKWDKDIVDTMDLAAGPNPRGQGLTLARLGRYFGRPKTDDAGGSKVWELYQAGDLDAIRGYCAGDVETVRHVYRSLMGLT